MFRFKLQPVLEIRKREERAKQVAVAHLERERVELVSLIESTQNAERAEQTELVGLLGEGRGVDLSTARLQAGATLHTRLRIRRAMVKLEGVEERLRAARAELAQAAAARKGVELLKDRQRAAYFREIDRSERAQLDDLSTVRAARLREAES